MRPVTVAARADILDEARAFDLNASQATEDGIRAAVKRAKAQAWIAESANAIRAYNKRIATAGMLITFPWVKS
jgi:antitoxin CcdA